MNISDDFKQYIDEDGLVQNTPNPPPHNGSGNGIRYTSEEAIILFKRGELSPERQRQIEDVFQRCQDFPGLIKRSPTHKDQQGPDDLVAAASYGSTCNQPLADAILSYGRDNPVPVKLFGYTIFKVPYVYNNVCPGTFKKPDKDNPDKEVFNGSAILLRQPQVITHFRISAKEKIGLLAKLHWSVIVAFNGFSKSTDQDGAVLNWHLINSYKNYAYPNFVMDFAVKCWYNKFRKNWPGGMKELLTKYFGFEHPLAKYWVD